MSETTSRSTSARRIVLNVLLVRLPIYLFVLLVMYVGSIGPMYWRWYESYAMYDSHEEALQQSDEVTLFYLPLLYACRQSKTLSDYVNWYIDLWV